MLKKLFLFAMLFSFLLGCSALDSVKDNNTLGSGTYYLLTFDSNGGSGDMAPVVAVNGSVKLPSNTFYRTGFVFIGWATTAGGDVVYGNEENINIAGNKVLYAVWQDESSSVNNYYTISFDNNGGEGVMDSQTVLQGSRVAISYNSFVKYGYNFTGWSYSNDNNPVFKNGDYITVTSNITLYACWSEDVPPVGTTYTIYYNANNGDGYMVPTKSASSSVQLSPNTFYRAGFSFAGWATSENGGVVYADNAVVTLNSDMNLYAVWKEVQYFKITFHANNNTDETSVVEVASDLMPYKLQLNTFTNGSKKFTGWESLDKSIKYIDGDDTVTLSNDIDLYATWSDNPVTIKFDANNEKNESTVIYSMAGNVIKLPKADFTRNGYELLGSYTCWEGQNYGGVLRFGIDYTVPSNTQEVVFSTGWRELPKPPLPVFGGNSDKYKNTYVLFNGVKMTKDDWIESLTKGLYYGVWNKDAGWYDSSQWHYNLCWAGTASNIIHWWYDRNKENIDNYYAHYASEEALKIRPKTGYYGKGNSDIFLIFRDHWADAGYKTHIGVEWFLFGSHYNKNGGAYLNEVLGDDSSSMIEVYAGITQYTFNTNINKVIEKGMMVGLAEVNGFGSHAISLWGVHYDDEGLVDGVIVSDSGTRSGNNAPYGYDTGLVYMHIEYDSNGKPFMTNDFGSRLPLTQMVLVSDGADYWKKYFDTHEPIR